MHILLCEDIRSTYNVGSIFRIADAAGIERLLLVGYTPAPIDRMGRPCTRLEKTALGSEKTVPWHQYKTTKEALAAHDGTPVVVEQTNQSTCYTTYVPQKPTIFILGNEVTGVRKETRAYVNHHIFLPMRGTKESLNVACCAAIIAYHFQPHDV